MATQKPGMDWRMPESAIMMRSKTLSFFSAQISPSDSASSSSTSSAMPVIFSVSGMRWRRVSPTFCLLAMEAPKSPCRMLPTQIPYCSARDLSRPYLIRISSFLLCGTRGPERISTGSPGIRCTSRKTRTLTVKISSRPMAIRLSANFSTQTASLSLFCFTWSIASRCRFIVPFVYGLCNVLRARPARVNVTQKTPRAHGLVTRFRYSCLIQSGRMCA